MTVFNPFTGNYEVRASGGLVEIDLRELTSRSPEAFKREYLGEFVTSPADLESRLVAGRELLRLLCEKPHHDRDDELTAELKRVFSDISFDSEPQHFATVSGGEFVLAGRKIIKGITHEGIEIVYEQPTKSEKYKEAIMPIGGRRAGKSKGEEMIRNALIEAAEKKSLDALRGSKHDWVITDDITDETITKKHIAVVRSLTKWKLDDEGKGESMKWNKELVGKAFEPYISELDEAFASSNGFILNEPRSVTRKTKDEGFSKIPLIGGEKLEGINCYMGKRDGIIFVFETEGVDGTIEINGAQALESLDGFEEFVNKALGQNLSEQIMEMAMSAEEKKRQQAIKESEAAYSEEFGSW